MARLRASERGAEVIMSAGTDERSRVVYIVPFSSLSDTSGMTLHDHDLCERLKPHSAQVVTPGMIRQAMLETAASGYAGEEAMTASQMALEGEAEFMETLHLTMLATIFEIFGFNKMDVFSGASMKSKEMFIRLQERAAQSGLSSEALLGEIRKVATICSSVGLNGTEGRLKRLRNDINAFAAEIEAYVSDANPDMHEVGNFIIRCAQHTLQIADKAMKEYDMLLKNPLQLATHADVIQPILISLVAKLSWLLDGWDQLLSYWSEAANHDDGRSDALRMIWSRVPIVPLREAQTLSASGNPIPIEGSPRRVVQAMHDWRTGTLDREMVERIEKAKAAAINRFGTHLVDGNGLRRAG